MTAVSSATARAVDLFCGAGGASQGLHEAGFDVVGFDYWQPAVDCHNANGLPALCVDLSDPAQDAQVLAVQAPLWWLSPPCQPFSAAGDGEGEFDDRDGFPWALRLLAAGRPLVAIIENVKGLTFRKHHAYFAGILASLRELGYVVEWRVLNCADYGVPQTRERTVIICRRDGERILWPAPTHTEHAGMFTERWVSMGAALGWGMAHRPAFTVMGGGTETGGAEPFSPSSRKAMIHTRQTNRDGSEVEIDVTDKLSPTVGTKVHGQWWIERPATTINGDTRVSAPGRHDPEVSGSQQADSIRCTIAELARLQDFPDHWQWPEGVTNASRMIGNAVPRTLARVLVTANRPITQEVAA